MYENLVQNSPDCRTDKAWFIRTAFHCLINLKQFSEHLLQVVTVINQPGEFEQSSSTEAGLKLSFCFVVFLNINADMPGKKKQLYKLLGVPALRERKIPSLYTQLQYLAVSN